MVSTSPVPISPSHSPWQSEHSPRHSPHTYPAPGPLYPQPIRPHSRPHSHRASSPYLQPSPRSSPGLSPRPSPSPLQQLKPSPHRPHLAPLDLEPTAAPRYPKFFRFQPTDAEAWPLNFRDHPSIEYTGYRRYDPATYAPYGGWLSGSKDASRSRPVALDVPNVGFY